MLLRYGPNKLYAEVNIDINEINFIDAQDFAQYLRDQGITTGINSALVKNILENRISNVFHRVAEGLPPLKGQDTQFNLLFRNELKAEKPRQRRDGSVDMHDLSYVIPVNKGARLLEIVPPGNGIPGFDVQGKSILPEPGIEIHLKLGENAEIDATGQYVIATDDGVASFEDNEIKVSHTLVIKGDIDYSVGNITFPGDILILGSVIDGFKVRSEGDVIVHKHIINATVETKGSIIVNGGINNRLGGYIKAGKNVQAENIQFGKVQAGKILIVEKEIIYSDITAGNQVIVDKEKSRIMGGRVRCFGRITVYDLGSRIEAGKMQIVLNEDQDLKRKLKEIDTQIKINKEQFEEVDKESRKIENYLNAPNLPSDEFHEFEKIYEDFNNKKMELIKKTRVLAEERAVIYNDLKENGRPELIVKNTLYPGVTLQFASKKLDVTKESKHCIIYEENGVIKFRPL